MSLLGPHLEAFLAIVRNKTVQAAAKELGLTQTGVTQRTRSLEQQLETTLFTRSRRGMLLTQEGEALFRYCQVVRDLEGETLAKIRGSGIRNEVRVSIEGPTSIMRSRIIPSLLPLTRDFGELLFSFQISDLKSGANHLREGKVLFAIMAPEEVAREMDSKLLKSEEYVLVGSPAWKRRKIEEVISRERIVDFDSSDDTTYRYLKKFKLSHLARSERQFVNNNESLIEMFEQGIGYGVLTREFAQTFIKAGRIALFNGGAPLENRLALAWYPRPQLPSYFKAVVGSLK